MASRTQNIATSFALGSSLIFAGLLTIFLAACTGSSSKSAAAGKELRVFTWSDYLQDDVIAEYTKETGTKVTQDYFSSNEELLAKVQATVQGGSNGYDLIVPSDYIVGNMIQLKLIAPLEKPKLNFLADFDASFMAPNYDPSLSHSVAFDWGTTGIAVNTKFVKEDMSKGVSWKDLLENPKYKGKVTMLDDAKENLHTALLVMGKTWATASEADIRGAFDYLKKTKKNLRIYTPEARNVLEADECWLCQVYSGDALSVMKKKPEVKYFIPREGATIWTDNLAIPVNARNVPGAYAFMNKILAADSAKRFTEHTFFPSANAKSTAMLDKSLTGNRSIYPDKETFKKLEYLTERTEHLTLIDRLWTELKSQ